MKKEYVKKSRHDFSKKVEELRKDFEKYAKGDRLPEEFLEKVEKLTEHEDSILEDAVDEYRRIKLRESNVKYRIENLLSDVKKKEDMVNLNVNEKEAFSNMMEKEAVSNDEKLGDIPGITYAAELDDNRYVCSTVEGNVIFISIVDGKKKVDEIIRVIPGCIYSITKLKITRNRRRCGYILVTGEEGYVCIISSDYKIVRKWKINEDDVILSASSEGTALVCTSEGDVYYLEENLEKWGMTTRPIIEDYYLSSMAGFEKDTYLMKTVDDRLDRLTINRVLTSRELWDEPILE